VWNTKLEKGRLEETSDLCKHSEKVGISVNDELSEGSYQASKSQKSGEGWLIKVPTNADGSRHTGRVIPRTKAEYEGGKVYAVR